MKVRKILVSIVLLGILIISGCSSSITYDFNVDTGDVVKIKCLGSDNHSITPSVPFNITKNGEKVSEGIFISSEFYEVYVESAKNDADSTVFDEGVINGNKYVAWNYGNVEWNYVIMIGESNTAILLGNITSQESAIEAFKSLEISLNNE